MIPFQVILSLCPKLQHIQECDLGLLILMRLPELEKLLHLLAIQFHPLTSELDQGCFGIDELQPFLLCDHLASNRELILVGDDIAKAEVATTNCCRSLLGLTQGCFEADLRASPPIGCPPRWDNYGVACFFEYPGTLFQECERLVQSKAAASWLVCG